MIQEEFLSLLGKDQSDADNSPIAADEIVHKGDTSSNNVEHIDIISILDSANDVLEHYGVDGQKWGVRNGPPSDKAKVILSNIDDLTTDEIRQWLSRIELEEKIENMTKDEKKKGNSYATKILQKSGDAILSSVVPAVTTFAFKKLVESVAGEEVVKDMFPKKKK